MRLNLKQGTDEWKAMRKQKITGTDASVILGLNPWKTAQYLLKQKLNFVKDDKETELMRMGSLMEEPARIKYEKITGNSMIPSVHLHDHEKWAMCSTDGIDFDEEKILEIKCGTKSFELAQKEIIPDYYMAQIQHNLWVTNTKVCDYFCFNGYDFVLISVKRNESFIKDMIEKEKLFYKSMQDKFLDESISYVQEQSSEEWQRLAYRWKQAKEMKDFAEKLEKDAKESILKLCENKHSEGAGIKVSSVTRKGEIDYKSIDALKSIDLEPYRKPETVYWTISST